MANTHRARTGALLLTGTLLAACSGGFDMDMRRYGDGLSTADAAMAARTETRPVPDNRGVISYPNYQVAVARSGDSVSTLASRVGVPAGELASYNGLAPDATLRPGELVALPRRVAEPSPATGASTTGPVRPSSEISVATIGPAIDRAEAQRGAPSGAATQSGTEPQRHRVVAGETAFSISRRYGVSVDALAEWNGLDADRTVRVGQQLLIPPTHAVAAAPAATPPTSMPGQGTATPTPPSAAQPLPQERVPVAVATPPAPDLNTTAASDTTRLLTPVPGRIVRPYAKGRNDGIDIAAAAGTPVKAADAGTVAAITRDTDGVPIVVIRHAGNLLTVYAGVDALKVEKGATVSRGQQIASVRAGDSAALHFEVREGFESVDPGPYLD